MNKAIFILGFILMFTNTSSARDTPAQDGPPPYEVGSTTLFLHDESRPFDTLAGVEKGVRTMITEIWYPVDRSEIPPDSKKATYGDYVFGNRAVHKKMMQQTTFFHLTKKTVRTGVSKAQIDEAIEELFLRERNSYTDAPLAKSDRPRPVVLMSHGDAGSRYSMETVCEYLAANGYIVVTPEHTGSTPFTMIGEDPLLSSKSDSPLKAKLMEIEGLLNSDGTYGNAATYGQTYIPFMSGEFSSEEFLSFDQALVERVNDLRATLTHLDGMNKQGFFAGQLDMENVGLMARSFGGATTLAAIGLEKRFKAGFAVVSSSLPDIRNQVPKDKLVQPPAESVVFPAKGTLPLAKFNTPVFLLSGGEDALIIGAGMAVSKSFGVPMPKPGDPHPLLRQAHDTSETPTIMSVVQNTNHGSFGVAAPYWFPQLKPNTFPQVFDATKEYTLLDAKVAHTIQNEMALAFFGLTMMGNTSKLELIKSNPWQKYQVNMATKGF